MRRRAIEGLVLVSFVLVLSHIAWHAFVAPLPASQYMVGGQVQALFAPGSDAKRLYLRRQLFLPRQPRHAWVQVLGRDHVSLYVNGVLAKEATLDGFPLALVVDLAPYMRSGPNVIALVAHQTTVGEPPAIAVEGAYDLGDVEHPLRADDQWRCATCFERKAFWWFQPQFDDRHWPFAAVGPRDLRAKVAAPPQATKARRTGQWITPVDLEEAQVSVRREFELSGRARVAWLRLTATASYRLAVNGVLIDRREDQLGTVTPVPPVQRIYDLTGLMRRGRNVVAVALTASTAGPPHLLADLEVEDDAGERLRLGSDGSWLQRPGLPRDWANRYLEAPADWRPCHAEPGDLDMMPWEPRRENVEVVLPFAIQARAWAQQAALIVGVALVTWLACTLMTRWLRRRSGQEATMAARVVYLALVPPAAMLAGALLATCDPRFLRQDVYRPLWVGLALALVLVQWALLALFSRWGRSERTEALALRSAAADGPVADEPGEGAEDRQPRIGWAVLVLVLMGVGFWVRFKDIDTEPLHPDEWWNYTATKGFLKRWYPSVQNHEDLPTSYSSTYEIMPICGPALVALVYDRDYFVVRFPSICWATLTIWLLAYAGRKMFSPATGLAAAALFAFAPIAIQMANFGRYYSQLPFLALLCVYFFWKTIQKTGAPVDRRALWLCVGSFFALYLTWEAGALMAVGMMLAAVIHRRGHLRSMLRQPAVWVGMLVLLLGIGLQYANRTFQQIERMWYGSGGSDVTLVPMWRYPTFQPWYYLLESTWSPDTFLPLVGLAGACILAVRHSFRKPLVYLLIVYLTTVTVLGVLLPLTLWRYAYWQSPLLVLVVAAALVGGLRSLVNVRARGASLRPGWPAAWRLQARATAAFVGVLAVALGCGSLVQLTEMDRLRSSGYRLGQLKFPHLKGAADYLREHFQEGDVVMTTLPHVLDHYWGRKSDYWLQTLLSLQASIDDKRTLPLHKIVGTVMIPDMASVDWLFAKAQRVWYIAVPSYHAETNDPAVSAYLVQNMDVVYEDFWATIMLVDANHRTQVKRLIDQQTLGKANLIILPFTASGVTQGAPSPAP